VISSCRVWQEDKFWKKWVKWDREKVGFWMLSREKMTMVASAVAVPTREVEVGGEAQAEAGAGAGAGAKAVAVGAGRVVNQRPLGVRVIFPVVRLGRGQVLGHVIAHAAVVFPQIV